MHRSTHSIASAALVLALGAGCAGDLSDELPKNEAPIGQHGRVTNSQDADGAIATQINAADAMSWVYFHLASGREVMPQSPQSSTEWDLAAQRYHIKLNGGASGSGGVEAGAIPGAAFTGVTQAPPSGYVTDQPDSGDEDTDPDYAFAQLGPWYSYNSMSHTLTPKEQVYIVRATSGTYYKLQMTAYYDRAGSSGFPTFRWKAIAAP